MSFNFSTCKAKACEYVDRVETKLSKAGPALQFTEYAAIAANSISQLNYGNIPAPYSSELATATGSLRTFFSAIRVIHVIKEILTLNMFRKTVGIDEKGVAITQRRSLIVIASKVAFAAFRFLSAACLLHTTKLWDLGKHATRRLGNGMFFFLIVGSGIEVVKAGYKHYHGTGSKSIGERRLNTTSSLLDLSSLPVEFGFLMGGNPVFSLVGAGICLLASGITLLRGD